MDYMCTQDMAQELQPRTYKATSLTQMLLLPLFNDAVTQLSVIRGFMWAYTDLAQPRRLHPSFHGLEPSAQ